MLEGKSDDRQESSISSSRVESKLPTLVGSSSAKIQNGKTCFYTGIFKVVLISPQ